MTLNGVFAVERRHRADGPEHHPAFPASLKFPLPFLAQQIDAASTDIRPDAVRRSGWYFRPAHCDDRRAAAFLSGPAHRGGPRHGGHLWLPPDRKRTPSAALREQLFPLAEVITPNRQEAEVLSGRPIHSREEMLAAARAIAFDCDCSVLLKGGHSDTDADDLLVEADGTETWFAGRRIANPNTHGTGCTLSSAIAANLAKGYSLPQAIARAKGYITAALSAELDLGAGSGPLDHTLGGKDIFTWMNGAPDAIQE